MEVPPPSWVLQWPFSEEGGQCGDGQTSSSSCHFPVVVVARWRRGVVLLLLATRKVGEECFGSSVGFPQWW